MNDEDQPLPPSAFLSHGVVTSRPSHRDDTGALLLELERLRQENRAVRVRGSQEEDQERLGVAGLRTVVSEQAGEVTRLRRELEKARSATARMEGQLDSRDKEVVSIRSDFQERLDQICSDHNRQLAEARQKLEMSEMKVAQGDKECQSSLGQMRAELERVTREGESVSSRLRSELETRDREAGHLREEVSRLKSYTRDVEEKSIWRQEKDLLDRRVSELTLTKESLESSIELLNIRLKSVQEICEIQQREVARSSGSGSERVARLLSAWRHNVLALLVQRESTRLDTEQQERKRRAGVASLEDRLVTMEAELRTMELKEREARADSAEKARVVKELTGRLDSSQSAVAQAESRLSEAETLMRGLVESASSALRQAGSSEERLSGCLRRMQQLEHRVEFATSRLPLLRAQMARLRRCRDEVKTVERGDEVHIEESLSLCREELSRVRSERDQLINQVEEEAKTFHERVEEARMQVAAEVESLRTRIQELENELRRQEESLSTHEAEVVSLAEERAQILTARAARECDLESALSSARRELAQAVLDLRQAQREVDREQRERETQVATLQEEYSTKEERLRRELRAIEAERNLMRTTLRQEGLLSSRPRPRDQAPHVESKREVSGTASPEQDLHCSVASREVTQEKERSEDILKVIDEVKTLTQSLSDSDEEF